MSIKRVSLADSRKEAAAAKAPRKSGGSAPSARKETQTGGDESAPMSEEDSE